MTDQERQQFRAEVIARKNVPTIPAVLSKILKLSDSVDTNTRELVAVIEKDQALTGKTLRLANSAFFGQSRRVATIPRALILLGFSTIRNLALSVKLWDALGNGVARPRLDELWAHSVACALAAKIVSARLRAGDPDEAFTVGLLHDVGRLVLSMRFRDGYWDVVEGGAESESIDAWEREAFGLDHAEVGAWMLEAWALPPEIVEGVRQHHAEPERLTVPGIVAIADRLIGWTDLATRELDPRAEDLIERTSEQGFTRELWDTTLAQLGTSPGSLV